MTRRTKVLLYTWLLSWAVATLVVLGWVASYDWLPAGQRLAGVLASYGVPRPFQVLPHCWILALAFGPVAYLCWRAVDKFAPPDEDED